MQHVKTKLIYLLFLIILFDFNQATFASQVNKLPSSKIESKVTEVSPVEDLMREHGALSRILLIYDEIIRRIDTAKPLPTKELTQATEIIRSFIQDYHEKLEENYVFVYFKNDPKLGKLTKTLIEQHRAGRKIIDKIISLENAKSAKEQKELVVTMHAFINMYRPHKSREDTILFPAFHAALVDKEYQELGETFEDEEHKLFGEEGFTTIIHKIEAIEKSLGIYKLSQFTP